MKPLRKLRDQLQHAPPTAELLEIATNEFATPGHVQSNQNGHHSRQDPDIDSVQSGRHVAKLLNGQGQANGGHKHLTASRSAASSQDAHMEMQPLAGKPNLPSNDAKGRCLACCECNRSLPQCGAFWTPDAAQTQSKQVAVHKLQQYHSQKPDVDVRVMKCYVLLQAVKSATSRLWIEQSKFCILTCQVL